MRTCHQLESRGLRPLDPGEGKVIGGVCVGLLVNLITIYHSASSAHPQGGGDSGTERLPTAKRPRRADMVKAKIKGRLTPLKAKKRATSN